LEQIVKAGGVIYRAVPSRPWPGTAALEVAHVWLRNEFVQRSESGAELRLSTTWEGQSFLDDKPVPAITAFLAAPGKVQGKPYRLKANEGKSFQGSIVLGMGFVLTPEEAQALIQKDKRNKDVLFPYLNREDLNSRPDQSPSRWVINFQDWPLERGARGEWRGASEEEKKRWLREGRVPSDYPRLSRSGLSGLAKDR
jgi:hypothetical protein